MNRTGMGIPRERIQQALAIAAVVLPVLAVLVIIGQVLAMLAPVTTVIFVAVFTVRAIRRQGAIPSVGGVLIYFLGWPLAEMYGNLAGQVVCGAGVLLWFWTLIQTELGTFRSPTLA